MFAISSRTMRTFGSGLGSWQYLVMAKPYTKSLFLSNALKIYKVMNMDA